MAAVDSGFDNPADLYQAGPTLHVLIGYDHHFRSGGPDPDLPGELHPALVDTGATHSCIDIGLAERLGLPVVDRQVIAGIGGRMEAPVYAAQIRVPGLDSTVHGAFDGVRLAESGQPHVALIGRSFLLHFTMTYEGRTGRVVISDD